jgi:undecaprenyl-diphosphatase
MLETLNHLDTDFFLFLNHLHADGLDEAMYWISETKVWIPFYGLIIFLLFRSLTWQKAIVAILAIVLLIVLTDRISSGFFKPTFHRLRPTHEPAIEKEVHIVHDYRGGDYGFISSHAANTFGLAMFLFLLLGKANKKWALLFLWAALVSYSRIYLGVHYPLDILSGWLLGVICALGIWKITLWSFQKIERNQQIKKG